MDFDRTKEFEKIIKEMLDIYIKKNANYGNSFGKAFEELGPISGVTRLYDKMNRIIALTKGSENNYESLEDTFIDLANYAIMNLIEMKYQKEKIKELVGQFTPLEVVGTVENEDGIVDKIKVKVGNSECCCQLDS